MAMNIRSITELPDYPLSTPLTADSSTALSTALKDAITGWEIDGGGLGSIGFQMLSCAKNSYIEVATQNKSYKLDLNKILDNINKTMAYVAWLQSSGITKEEAEELFVPYTGNMHAGGKAVTGLYIATPDTGTALKVDGQAIFQDSKGINIILSTKSDGICYTEKLSGKEISSEKLTGKGISGTNLTVNNLYAGLTGSDYKLSATNQIVTIADLTATNLTAGNLCAGSTTDGNSYKLSVNSNTAQAAQMKINQLTSYNLSSAKLTAVNLSAGGMDSTTAYALQVLASPETSADGQQYYIKTKELSATKLATPTFQANTLIAIDSLSAGEKTGGGYYVVASKDNNVKGLSATMVTTDTLNIKDLQVTNTMYVGQKDGNQWNVTADKTQCTIQSCKANSLTADGIAQLTAKAACWS